MTASSTSTTPPREPFILYEDNHLLGVFKPSSVLVQGDKTGDSALNDWTKAYLKHKYNKPGEVYLGTLHRLDRPVSGLVLFAKTSKAASRMSLLFQKGQIEKEYLALCSGRPVGSNGNLTHYLLKNTRNNQVEAFSSERKGSKKATLSYTTLSDGHGISLLKVQPKTGRSHQIRAQLSAFGHPIMGDVKYGSSFKTNNRSLYLYCHAMHFIHPVKKELITVSAPTPFWDEWQSFQSVIESHTP